MGGVFTESFSASLSALAAMHELSSLRQSATQTVSHTFGNTRSKLTALPIQGDKFYKMKELVDKNLAIERQEKPNPIKIFGRQKVEIKPLAFPPDLGALRVEPPIENYSPVKASKDGRLAHRVLNDEEARKSWTLSRKNSAKSVAPLLERRRSSVAVSDSPSSKNQFLIGSSSKVLVRRPSSRNIESVKPVVPDADTKALQPITAPEEEDGPRNFTGDGVMSVSNIMNQQDYSMVFKDFKIKHINDFENFPLENYDQERDAHFNYEYFIQKHHEAFSIWIDQRQIDAGEEFEWLPCWVNDYDPERREFTIRWKHNLQTKKVRRMNIYFKGETEEDVKKRRKAALVSRCVHLLSLSLKDAALNLETVPPCRVIFNGAMLQRIILA